MGLFCEAPACNVRVDRFYANQTVLTNHIKWNTITDSEKLIFKVIPCKRSHYRFPMKLAMLMLQDKEMLKT